jgi:hypothetical protein
MPASFSAPMFEAGQTLEPRELGLHADGLARWA